MFNDPFRASDIQSGTVSRFSSKLKGAIRGAIDGAPLEATEVPTVWDAFTDEPQVFYLPRLIQFKTGVINIMHCSFIVK